MQRSAPMRACICAILADIYSSLYTHPSLHTCICICMHPASTLRPVAAAAEAANREEDLKLRSPSTLTPWSECNYLKSMELGVLVLSPSCCCQLPPMLRNFRCLTAFGPQSLELGVWGREFDTQACNSCKGAVEAGYRNVAAFIPVPALRAALLHIPLE
jgi:hypothetical protein